MKKLFAALTGLRFTVERRHRKLPPAERLAQIRTLRGELPQGKFLPRDIDAFKRRGRA